MHVKVISLADIQRANIDANLPLGFHRLDPAGVLRRAIEKNLAAERCRERGFCACASRMLSPASPLDLLQVGDGRIYWGRKRRGLCCVNFSNRLLILSFFDAP